MCFLVIVYIYIDIIDTLELRFSRKKKFRYDGKNSTYEMVCETLNRITKYDRI